jgi:predicted GIY-YIG superfamily endonuclease/ribosomal protein S14
MEQDLWTIYVLQLENGYYYVGRTKNLERRIEDHATGYGSAWTKKYKFVKHVETLEGDSLLEDLVVKRYMQKHGIHKVRGGSYSQVILPEETINHLEREFRGAEDSCFRCGRTGHFIRQCYAKTDVSGKPLHFEKQEPIIEEIPEPSEELLFAEDKPPIPDFKPTEPVREEANCTRCGRTDHWKITCTAMEDIHGQKLEPNPIGMIGSLVKNWWYSK